MEEYYKDRFCACGCGGKIKVQRHHKFQGIPVFIYNHHFKLRTGCNNHSWKGGVKVNVPLSEYTAKKYKKWSAKNKLHLIKYREEYDSNNPEKKLIKDSRSIVGQWAKYNFGLKLSELPKEVVRVRLEMLKLKRTIEKEKQNAKSKL